MMSSRPALFARSLHSAMNNPTDQRIQAFQAKLPSHTVAIISDPESVEYFTGFHTLVLTEREAFACISQTDAVLLHAAFSPVPQYTPKSNLRLQSGTYPDRLAHVIQQFVKGGDTTVWIDKQSLFVTEFEAISTIDRTTISSLDRRLIWSLRMHKSEAEKAAIAEAGRITAQAFAAVKNNLKPGVTEQAVREQLEAALRAAGAELAFPTIVAFGPHTALPHHQPTDTQLTAKMPILIDMGARYQGYCADMTRSWWFGEQPDSEYQTISQTVDEAYQQVIAVLNQKLPSKKPISVAELDQAARDHIAKAGYGEYFIHTTGHGLGLAIHEQPSIHLHNSMEFSKDMVITVEPGIYLPDRFGYRYENTITSENDFIKELTKNL